MSTNNTFIINLVGYGRVGKALLKLLLPVKTVSIQAIYNRSPQPESSSDISSLPQADLHLLAVSDSAIREVASQLLQTQKNTCLLHFSGAHPACICNPEQRQDIHCASLHPPISFSTDPEEAALALANSLCTLEGDPTAVDKAKVLCKSLKIATTTIDSTHKATYHAACVMASNYLVTLATNAKELFEQAGMETLAAKTMTEQLLKSSLPQLVQQTDYRQALTGPLQRGDIDTIKKHCEQLPQDKQALYRMLGRETLKLTQLSTETAAVLSELLQAES